MRARTRRSKRHFAASSSATPRRPPAPVFFIDRDLGRYSVPDALRQAGARVEVHADHFPDDATDDVWLKAVGERGWVVVTKDKAIRHRDTELAALKQARVAAFVLTAKGLTGPQNGAVLAKALPAMNRHVMGNRPPFIAAVSTSSRLTMLFRGHKPRSRARKGQARRRRQ